MHEPQRWAIPALLIIALIGTPLYLRWERRHPTSYTRSPRHLAHLRAEAAAAQDDAVIEATAQLEEAARRTTVPPNPYSPYADADPNYRHLFHSPVFFNDPAPGVLAPTVCERLAVVPELLIVTGLGRELPDGLCPACVTVMQGGDEPRHPVSDCRECESVTGHDGLCALCRQDKHEAWWPTRDQASTAAAEETTSA
jgi:hypothetical protein